MNNYIHKHMLVLRTKKLLVRSTRVGSDISYSNKQTEKILIRQLFQELPDLGLLCLKGLTHFNERHSDSVVDLRRGIEGPLVRDLLETLCCVIE